MTTRPPLSMEPFSDEERELAARLARLDASAGPSLALDVRVLDAARRQTRPPRTVRRWPTAVGAAAVLVVAVGLAWQLRPMFELPPPAARHAESAGEAATQGAHSETVVQIESVPRSPAPVAATEATAVDAPAVSTRPAAAALKAPPVAGGAVSKPIEPPRAAVRSDAPDFVDEAVPMRDARVAPAPPPPPAPAPPASQESMRMAAPQSADVASPAASAEAAGARTPDIEADARLPVRGWIARIRERRDSGDVDAARASLQRFVAAHPRVRVPADLRPLLDDADPWSP